MTASPIRIASDTEFRTVASRACAAVSENSVDEAAPPNSTAAARSRRSIQCPEMAWKMTRLPRSSVITAGLGEIPASCMVTCGNLREGASHSVRVDHGKAHPRRPGDRQHAVPAADLAGHQRGHPAPGQVLQMVAEALAFVAVLDLLHADRGGTDPAARHDQGVIRQFVHVHQGGRAEILGGLQGLEQGEIGIAAASRAQHRTAAR